MPAELAGMPAAGAVVAAGAGGDGVSAAEAVGGSRDQGLHRRQLRG